MIQALERASKILKITAAEKSGIRLCDLARQCGLKRNTLYNLAETLVQEELLGKTEDGKYVIGNFIKNYSASNKRENYLERIYNTLTKLQTKYPEASFFYTELGKSDIIGKIFFPAGSGCKGIYLENSTLPPYITVCGIIFFAFLPEEQLEGLKQKNPFEYSGLQAWGSIKKFQKQINLAKKNHYSETPLLIPENELKIGIPVEKKSGEFIGCVTFHLKNIQTKEREKIRQNILQSIKEMSNF